MTEQQRQQQIEEMYQDFIDYRHATLCKASTYEGMCKNFVELGYQKVSEDKVVLEKKEYDTLNKKVTDLGYEIELNINQINFQQKEIESLNKKIKRYEGEREYIGKTMLDNTRKFAELTIDFENMLDDVYELAAKEAISEILTNMFSVINKSKSTIHWEKQDVEAFIVSFAKQHGVEI